MAEGIDTELHAKHAEAPALSPMADVEEAQVRDDDHVLHCCKEAEVREGHGDHQEDHRGNERGQHAGPESLPDAGDDEGVRVGVPGPAKQRDQEGQGAEDVGQDVHQRHLRSLGPSCKDLLAREDAQATARHVHRGRPARVPRQHQGVVRQEVLPVLHVVVDLEVLDAVAPSVRGGLLGRLQRRGLRVHQLLPRHLEDTLQEQRSQGLRQLQVRGLRPVAWRPHKAHVHDVPRRGGAHHMPRGDEGEDKRADVREDAQGALEGCEAVAKVPQRAAGEAAAATGRRGMTVHVAHQDRLLILRVVPPHLAAELGVGLGHGGGPDLAARPRAVPWPVDEVRRRLHAELAHGGHAGHGVAPVEPGEAGVEDGDDREHDGEGDDGRRRARPLHAVPQQPSGGQVRPLHRPHHLAAAEGHLRVEHLLRRVLAEEEAKHNAPAVATASEAQLAPGDGPRNMALADPRAIILRALDPQPEEQGREGAQADASQGEVVPAQP
mmetsp:Transcript_45272/g.144252  ORF Transcript_45272/g.144252 Transcript_45272/m.144252 type:complete len:493 (-) Transcript_45272:618-2096(-)